MRVIWISPPQTPQTLVMFNRNVAHASVGRSRTRIIFIWRWNKSRWQCAVLLLFSKEIRRARLASLMDSSYSRGESPINRKLELWNWLGNSKAKADQPNLKANIAFHSRFSNFVQPSISDLPRDFALFLSMSCYATGKSAFCYRTIV